MKWGSPCEQQKLRTSKYTVAYNQSSGVGAGGATAPTEFGQNLKKFGQKSFDIFNNI